MRRSLLVCGIAVLFLGSMLTPAQGGIVLSSGLVSGSTNTLQDQSVEQVFDINQNGFLDAGDVVAGFLRLDNNINIPAQSFSNSLYAVFSEQVSAAPTVIPVGANAIYQVSFAPTVLGTTDPVTGNVLDLATLSGLGYASAPAAAALGGVGSIAAIFEKSGGFPLNYVSSAPPATTFTNANSPNPILDIFDFTKSISTLGTPDLVAGFGGLAGPDFAQFLSSVSPAGGLAIGVLTGGTTGVSVGAYSQGLSVITNFDPLIEYNRLVGVSSVTGTPPGVSLHDVGITLGSVTGSTDATLSDGLGHTYTPSNRDSQQIIVNPTIVPEPCSLLIWGLSAGFLGMVAARRRKARTLA